MTDRTQPFASLPLFGRRLALVLAATTLSWFGSEPARAGAEAALVIEADSGKVLHAENAGYPWYPASITKLMTTYVTLRAVKDGRIGLDTLLTVSPVAMAQSPSKMGFQAGTDVTVDNALKMMLVRSANDMAVVLAEGVSGSVEGFADEMNRTARRLGMTQTNYVNPNGLPADGQVSSARDLAILARALIRDLPEYDSFWNIPAIRFGKRLTRNFNALIDRYPGADGMKTGFICASGFNLVASATRDGRRLIAVVLGAPSSPVRAQKAAQLLERGFNAPSLSWLTPSLGTVENLAAIDAAPPNLREEMCGKKRRRPAAETDDPDDDVVAGSESGESIALSLVSARPRGPLLAPAGGTPSSVVNVYVGPARRPPGTQVAAAGPVKLTAEKPEASKPRLAAASMLPWTSFSPRSLADHPPPSLAPLTAIPLPRARPKAAR